MSIISESEMSERPTPETDAAWACFKGYMEPLQDVKDLSRKLERERDEARTTIEDAKRALNATDYEGILLAAMRVKEERDEAREALREIWQSGDAFLPRVDQETINRWRRAAGWREAK